MLVVLVWILIIYPEFVIKNYKNFAENNYFFNICCFNYFIYLLNVLKNNQKLLNELYLSEKNNLPIYK